ncbi:MAG: hypothetical protein K2O89_01935 [Clostridia bacterium]|nr:hypothetical protein [Clostridia bacterium]
MSKFRNLILITGLLLIAVAAALLTVLILYATGTIKTDPIELVYSVASAEKDYDGTPLTVEDYTLDSGKLLEGHTASVQVIGAQTDVGSSESTLQVKICDKNGFDVSDEYAVKVNAGTLTVDPKNISVVIPDSTVIYSGKEVYFNDFEIIDGELAKGHKLAGLNTTLLNAGDTLPNDIEPLVYDPFDNPVTENYNITFEMGTVKVLARTITVKPKDITKIYDGITLTATEFEISDGSLVAGQTARAKIVSEAGFAASAVNCVYEQRILIDELSFEIYADDGVTPVSQNYNIYFDTAFMTIQQRPLKITTLSETFTYDGEEHYNDAYIDEGDYAPNQILNVKSFPKVCDVTDGEGTKNEIRFEILSGENDVISNYSVQYVYGTLKVAPFEITVQTNSYEKVYDGNELGNYIIAQGNTYTTVPELPRKFNLTASISTEVSSQVNVNSGTFSLINVSIQMNGTDCTGNFTVDVKEGAYAITPKPFTVTLNDLKNTNKFIYGETFVIESDEAFGEAFIDTDFTYNDFQIIQPQDLTAGVHSYSAKCIKADLTNYELKIIDGSVTIEKRKVDLVLSSKAPQAFSMTYNGLNSFYDVKTDYLAIKDETDYAISSAEFNNIFNVAGKTQNITVKSVEVSSKGEDITSNLEINYAGVNIRVTVTPRLISFTYKPYNYVGYWEGANPDYSVLAGLVDVSAGTPLANGDAIVETEVSVINEDWYVVSSVSVVCGGVDVSGLYEINEDYYGQVIIPAQP